MTTYGDERLDKAAQEYQEIPVLDAGKRLGVQWTPWMGDWFTSWSPRNSNSNAEGYWDHWVDLALGILRDPMTAITRPEVAELAKQLPEPLDQYSGCQRQLTDQELAERMRSQP